MNVQLTSDGPRHSFHGKAYVEINAATTGVDCDSLHGEKFLGKDEKYENVINVDVRSDQVF